MNKKIIIPAILTILLVAQPAVIGAISANHTFAIVAERGDMIDGVMLDDAEDPSLNNVGGVVVFEGEPAGGSIIFTLTDEIARDGDTIDGVTINSSPNDPDINDFGVVVFEASFDDGGNTVNAIFTQTDFIAAEGDVIDGETLTNVADPSINNAGTIVFDAGFIDGIFFDAIFSQTNLLVKAGDTVGGKLLELVNDPFINNNGEVVFEGEFDDGGNIVTGIFALNADSLLVQEGDMIDGKVIDSIDHPAMNDNGVLIFNASFDDGGNIVDGIFTQTRLLVQEGDIVEGNVLTDVADPVINNAEDFVFEAEYGIGNGDSFMSVILATHTQVVGGELLQIDSTALVLAGLQSSAIWMLPILAGAAGASAFYIKTRMNKDQV